jgi:hypothetical protein
VLWHLCNRKPKTKSFLMPVYVDEATNFCYSTAISVALSTIAVGEVDDGLRSVARSINRTGMEVVFSNW